MKNVMTICAVVICFLQMSPVLATDPYGDGSGGNTVHWYYESPLTVVENITPLGGGSYQYAYSFVNVDTSPIWDFVVNTTFVTQGGSGGTKFTGHSSWGGPTSDRANSVSPQYDARNLDPAIVGLNGTYTLPFVDSVTAIKVGEIASGLSFIASTYNPSPKYYYYETISSGYTQKNGTGKVAAVGLTIPEPCTLALLALGGVGLLRKRRG